MFDDPSKYFSMLDAVQANAEREQRKQERLARLAPIGNAVELYNNGNKMHDEFVYEISLRNLIRTKQIINWKNGITNYLSISQ